MKRWEYRKFKRTELSPRIIYFIPTVTFWQDTTDRPVPFNSRLSFNWLIWELTFTFKLKGVR